MALRLLRGAGPSAFCDALKGNAMRNFSCFLLFALLSIGNLAAYAVPTPTNAGPSNYPYYLLTDSSTVVMPGDVLSVGFSVKGGAPFVRPTSIAICPTFGPCPPVEERVLSSEPASPNELELGFRFFDYFQSPGTTFRLFQNDTLAYTHTRATNFQSIGFTLPDSIIDFSTILDGTFRGRMDISSPDGPLSFDGAGLEMTSYFLRECVNLPTGGRSCSQPLVPGLSIDSAEVIRVATSRMPEPSALWLFLLAAGAASFSLRRR